MCPRRVVKKASLRNKNTKQDEYDITLLYYTDEAYLHYMHYNIIQPLQIELDIWGQKDMDTVPCLLSIHEQANLIFFIIYLKITCMKFHSAKLNKAPK